MQEPQIRLKEKIGYSLGDTASNLFFQTFMLFLMYFYTDVFGLAAGAVGTMFLVTRVWDAIFDPIVGMIADRTSTKWGKFRPYLLFLALPFGLFGIALFWAPNLAATGKMVYAYFTYTLMMMIYSAINVPYSALMGVITPNAMQRTVISSFRFVAAFAGGLIVQGSVMSLVKRIGGTNPVIGWRVTMTLISILAVALFIITFLTTRERVAPPQAQSTSLRRDLKDLFTNEAWLLIAFATVMQLSFIALRNGAITYYFKYFVGNQTVAFMGRSVNYSYETLLSTFLISGTVMTILGAILTNFFTKLFDKRKSYVGFMVGAGLFTALFMFLRPQSILLMFLFQLIASFCMGPLSVLQWSIYTDTADYGEWKNNRRATALVMAASLFALKLGLAFGGAMQGWLMNAYGFVANQVQTESALNGIRLMMSLYPAIGALVAALFMIFYPLTNRKLVEIEKELNSRREA